jgi:hypothetical protein
LNSKIFTDPNSDRMSLFDFLNWHNPLKYNLTKVRCASDPWPCMALTLHSL